MHPDCCRRPSNRKESSGLRQSCIRLSGASEANRRPIQNSVKCRAFQPQHAFFMNLERLRREFPDYDITTLPTLPEGYFDTSKYIDAAPSFENEERGLKVYVDYANYADRESGRTQRFCVSRYDEEAGDFEDVALSSNNWAEVTRFLTT